MRYCVTVEKRTFASYVEAEKAVRDWLERINSKQYDSFISYCFE